MADDVFQLHDHVFRRTVVVDERVVYATYAGAIAVFLLAFLPRVLRSDYVLLALAFAAFAVSFAADTDRFHWDILVEDGAKLVGIAAWGAYFVRECAGALVPSTTQRSGITWTVSNGA